MGRSLKNCVLVRANNIFKKNGIKVHSTVFFLS